MRTLLFVDDEPRVLQGLQRQLHSMRDDWEMNFAGGGYEALEFMKATPVDIVITDMTMPGMDGAPVAYGGDAIPPQHHPFGSLRPRGSGVGLAPGWARPTNIFPSPAIRMNFAARLPAR